MAYPGDKVKTWVSPLDEEQVQPAGIDLRVDKIFEFHEKGTISISSKQLPLTKEVLLENGFWYLKPGAYKVRFREIVKVPVDAVGFCHPRSSLLRMGVAVHCAVWDPGYMGRGEALLVVYNAHGVRIEKNARIAQLVFISLKHPPSRTYSGSYQGENID